MSKYVTSPIEPKGLIHAMLLDGQGGSQRLTWNEVNQLDEDQSGLWLHFDYSEKDVQDWLTHCSGLNEIAVDGLLNSETRPHVLTRGNNLLLILRGVNLNPGANPEDMVSVRVWSDGKTLISTRKRMLLSTQDIVEKLENGTGATSVSRLLIDWIDHIVARMNDTINLLEDNILEIEENIFVGEPKELRSSLLKIRQQSIGIRRYIAPQREALSKLGAEPLVWLNDIHRLTLRSIADRQIRYIEDIDALKERASMVQDELISRVSEQLNNRSYVLTVIAAIFLPLGFFTGLMGINVGGMPGVDSSVGFWIVVWLCVGASGLLGAFLHWKKWL
ncbi:magnesium transporter CorA [Vibrio panuliri]|uniref:Magnesium transporter CorA n=1 Tax=Vibrio panuliri TaxID=1381081 RepID=A0A1Q9HRJ6_9VIBR|nr:zinc transporter ZntB [Vibrio panuliri]OLQ93455.1 magnesium transporter CorA [Vibrio panuliri]